MGQADTHEGHRKDHDPAQPRDGRPEQVMESNKQDMDRGGAEDQTASQSNPRRSVRWQTSVQRHDTGHDGRVSKRRNDHVEAALEGTQHEAVSDRRDDSRIAPGYPVSVGLRVRSK